MHGDKFWLSSQEVLLLSKGVEARDAANHPTIHGTAFYNKELTSLFVNSAEADRASGLPGKQASWDEQDLVLLEPRGGGSWEWEFWTTGDQWVFPVLPPAPPQRSSRRCLPGQQWGSCSWHRAHISWPSPLQELPIASYSRYLWLPSSLPRAFFQPTSRTGQKCPGAPVLRSSSQPLMMTVVYLSSTSPFCTVSQRSPCD